MKSRLKSPIVWAAIIAQICIIITMFSPSISEEVKTIGMCVVEILTILGILNNPTDCKKF